VTNGLAQPTISSTGPTCPGGDVTLSIPAFTGASVQYAWFKNGTAIENNSNQLFINAANAADAGMYTVMVTIDGCSTTSIIQEVVVLAVPDVSIAPVTSLDCTDGIQDISLDATIDNMSDMSDDLTYAWSGPNGFTSALEDPVLSNVNTSFSGTYTLMVFDSQGCTSAPTSVEIVINDGINQPAIIANTPVCTGEEIMLSVPTYMGANVTYEWTRDGIVIENNSNILNINAATAADDGDYQVTVTVDGCTGVSTLSTVEVFAIPAATIDTPPSFACTDGAEDYTFNANIVNGLGNLIYNWTGPDDFVSALANPSITNIDESKAGTYNLVVTDENGCSSAITSVQLAVDDALAQPFITTSENNVCTGGDITLSIPAYEGTDVQYVWTKDGTDLVNNRNELVISNATVADVGEYAVTVTVNECSATANAFDLQLQPQTMVTIDPVVPLDCAEENADVQLNATVTNATGNVSYEWTGPNGFRSTLEDPTLTDVDANDAGTYVLTVTSGNGCPAATQSIEVAITGALPVPVITGSGAGCVGETATLEVLNYNVQNITYEWFFNDVAIPNNSNQLFVNNLSGEKMGDYSVRVSRGDCSTTSLPYALVVFSAPSVSIENIPPVNCTNGANNLTLNATAIGGSGNYSYAWTGPNGYSSTQEDPQIVNINAVSSGTYSVVVSDENGCASASAAVVVDITDGIAQPLITPIDAVCAGDRASLSVTNYEGSQVAYQWLKDGQPFSNTTGNELILSNIAATDAGEYQVRVNVDGCTNTSNAFTLTVNERPVATIDIVAPDLCSDGALDIALTSEISGGSGDYTYQWTGPNGFSSSLTSPSIINAVAANSGSYNLVVTDENGCTSEMATTEVEINNALVSPIINAVGDACAGETITLSVPNYQSVNVRYEWYLNGDQLTNTANILTIRNVGAAQNGDYTVRVIAADCEATSEAFNINILSTPIVNIEFIAPLNCTSGTNNLTLNATAMGGSGNYSYQWTGPNNFESAQEDPQIVNANSSKSGTYNVVVTDENGCFSTMASVVVDVTDAIAQPIITSSGAACVGDEITLNVAAYEGTNVSYTWLQDGEMIQASGNQLILANARTEQAGDYRVTVRANGCSSQSTPLTVEVFDTPQITLNDVPPVTCATGETEITLTPNLTGGTAPFTYEWTGPNEFLSVNEEPVLINVNESMDGSYTLRVTDANGCASDARTIEVDITEAIIQPTITANQTVCEDEMAVLQVEAYEGIDVTYEWLKDGQPYSNTNNNEIVIARVQTADEGDYQVRVNVDGCSNTSNVFSLVTYSRPQVAIDIVTPELCSDGTNDIALTSNVTSGSGDYTYEWRGPNDFNSTLANPRIINATDENTGNYTVIVTDNNGCTSEVVTAEVEITHTLVTPVINAAGDACAGEVFTLSAPIYDIIGIQYEWYRDGNLLTNASNELTFRNVSVAQSGAYTVRVVTSECDVTSDTFNLEILAAPQVEIDNVRPMNCTTGINNLTMNATATGGSGDYSYEWTGPNGYSSTQEDPIIVNINSTKSGNYHLVVTDMNGCASARATVVVDITDGIQTPVITSSEPTCESGQMILEIPEVEGAFVSYVWQTPNGVTDNIVGLNSNRLIISPIDSRHVGNYRVMVTGNGCTERSEFYAVTTLEEPIARPYTFNMELCTGDDLALFANVQNGDANEFTYEWAGPNGFTSTLANPLVSDVSGANNGEYQVTISNGTGCSVSEFFMVDNIKEALETPTLATIGTICEGQALILFTGVSGERYEWVGPLGDDSNTLQLTGLTTADDITTISPSSPAYLSGEWRVRVYDTEGCASALSEPLMIEINPEIEAVATKSNDVCRGESVQLFANEVAGANYSWTVAGNPSTIISTERNPVITNLERTTTYQLEIERNGCFSQRASVTVQAEAAPVANPIANYNLNSDCSPNNLTLLANTTGDSDDYTYTWTGPNGFTSSAENPIIPNATSEYNGAYEVTVTNANGCSEKYVTEVISNIEDAIAQPIITGSNAGCIGETITLQVPQYNASQVTYRWRRNGTLLTSSTSNEFIINNLSTSTDGFYTVTVEVNDCVLLSNEYQITLNEQPTIEPMFALSNNCEGGVLTLNANPAANQDLTYEWRGPNGFSAAAATTVINNTSVNQNGSYTLIATAANGCSTTEEVLIENINPSPAQPEIIGAEQVCVGGDISLQTLETYPADVDYIWINGQGQVVGTDSILTLDSDAPEAIAPYRLRIEESGCFSAMSAPVTVTTVNAPMAIINTLESYCTGEDVQIFANSIAGATYEWRSTFTNELLSTDQNPIFYNLTEDLLLELTVRVPGCTQEAQATTRLDVNDIPEIVNIAGNNNVCEGSRVILSTTLSASGSGDITYEWTGPNGFAYTITDRGNTPAVLVLENVTSEMSGNYSMTAITAAGCRSNTESIALVINTLPATPALSVSESVVCQNSTIQLDVTPYAGSSDVLYEWTYDNGSGPVLINITTQPTLFLANAQPIQSGYYSVRIQTGDCESPISNIVPVEVYGVQSGIQALNSTSQLTPACAGDMVELILPFFAEATYQWFGPNGFTANTHNPVINPVSASAVGDYFATIDLNGCATVVAQPTTVYVNPTPDAPTLTSTANTGNAVCPGTDVTLNVSSSLSVLPNDVLNFEWYDALTDELLGVTDTSVFDLGQVNQTSNYYVVMTLNECTAVQSEPTTVNIIELPDNVFAFAGTDQDLCVSTSTTLDATPIEAGLGVWTSPSGAIILNPSDPNSEVRNLQRGENIFIWSISTGFCGVVASDTVSIAVSEISTDVASAGVDINVCGESTVQLNASVPSTALGVWTQPAVQIGEGVKIVDPNNPQTQITGLNEDRTYTFTWSLTQGTCTDFQSDEVQVVVAERPLSTAYISDDELFTCGDEEITIKATNPQSAEGRWTTASGATIVEAGSSTSSVFDIPMGESMFIWELTEGACEGYSADTLMVFSEPLPEAFPEARNLDFNGAPINIDVLANYELNDINDYAIRITNFPDHGQVINNGDGTLTYQVDQNYAGLDSLVYELCNVNCDDLCSEATVNFSISGVDFANDCFIFNIMTPNDDGKNDALYVSCAEQFPNNEVKVFNRWGDKVFEASGYLNEWEGTYEGRPLPAGTYYYTFKRDATFEVAEQGYITIFR
ncbi:MAG: gliding motility-associated C-terminal domain-containing protein, partial [Saprospiraceae bacterium]